MYLLDLQPLTVGAWTISSLALKLSSWPEELTTMNPIFLGISLMDTITRQTFKLEKMMDVKIMLIQQLSLL